MGRSEETIFAEAMEKSPDKRAEYLDVVCAGAPELRKNVESLLDAYEKGGFIESPPPCLEATIDQRPPEQPGDRIGPYKLLQKVGEGGMGVVYMAEQSEPIERRVALKIIKAGLDTAQFIARFEAERQALAIMDHPNIAQVFDAGTTDSGRPYFVMELVKGLPVTQYCDEKHLTPRERLELFVPICQAVQHAHQKGIIHRDLKPTNILVAQYDDKVVPKVIDFGVAKAISKKLTEKTMFTQYGQIVGTIEYMSPEQARFNQLDVDTRSDIYSLGVLLYELLTGETPFDKRRLRAAAFDEMLRIIREEEPPKPSTRLSGSKTLPSVASVRNMEPKQLSLLIRGELDAIVMKALDKERNRRYETAAAFADDLQRFLHHEPVVAAEPSASYRFKKFLLRHTRTAFATACIAAALLLGTAMATYQAFRAVRAERTAKAQEQLAVEQKMLVQRAAERELATHRRESLIAGMQRIIHETRRNGWSVEFDRKATEAARIRPDATLRNLIAAGMMGLEARLVRRLEHGASSLAFNPSGGQLLAGGTSADGQAAAAVTWNRVSDETQLLSNSGTGPVAFRDERHAVRLFRDPETGALSLWSLMTNTAELQFVMPAGETLSEEPIASIDRTASMVAWLSRSSNGQPAVLVWDGRSGELLHRLACDATSLAMSPDGKVLAVGDYKGMITVWDLQAGSEVVGLRNDRTPVVSLAFGTNVRRRAESARYEQLDGWLLAAGHMGGMITVWDLATSQPRSFCQDGAFQSQVLAFSPDNMTLASADRSPWVRLWDWATGDLLLELQGSDDVSELAFSPDGQYLAVAGPPPSGVAVFAIEGDRGIKTCRGLTSRVARTCFSPDGRYLAGIAHNWQVAIWDLDNGRLLHLLECPLGLTADNVALAFKQDGEQFAVSTGNDIRIWDIRTGQETASWHVPRGLCDQLGFTASGQLVSFRMERQVENDPHSPRLIRLRRLAQSDHAVVVSEIGDVVDVFSTALFADRYFVADMLGGREEPVRVVHVYDRDGLLLFRVPTSMTRDFGHLSIDPTGQYLLAMTSNRQEMTLVDLATRTQSGPVAVPACCISPGARWCVMTGEYVGLDASIERGISVYEPRKPTALVTFDRNVTVSHISATFDREGTRLAWGNDGGLVHVARLLEVHLRLDALNMGW